MTESSVIDKIPVIDIEPLIEENPTKNATDKVASEIGDACKNVGFFYVINHGISEAHFHDVFSVIKTFFELPLPEKMKIHMAKSNIYRGYTPVGNEVTNDQKDWNEAVDFGLDLPPGHPDVIDGKPLQGPNLWPESLPEFKHLLSVHWKMMVLLGSQITQGLALSLGLERDFFMAFTDKSQSAMRILHYPPQALKPDEDFGDGIGAHIDYGFLTILAQDEVGGLEVKNKAGEWISAPYIPGTLIINIGHMMQRWTNDFYKATMHRVKSRKNKERFSFPFFYEPNFDTVVTPLEKFCSREYPSQYQPFHFGNYLIGKYSSSYAENMKEV